MNRIVVAYDGSVEARRALAHISDFARPGDVVTLVNVMPEPGVGASIGPPTEARHHQWTLLDEARQLLGEHGGEIEVLSPVGDAASEILAAAREVGADLIVVGRHHGKAAHLLGSTSSRIVRAARCDVLVVHAADT